MPCAGEIPVASKICHTVVYDFWIVSLDVVDSWVRILFLMVIKLHGFKLMFFLLSAESRCDKDMDALSGYAMCLPNLTRLHFPEHRPILCVEIKVSVTQVF